MIAAALTTIAKQAQEVSFVSRRRLDDDTFDADAVDEEGLPLVRLFMTSRLLLYL